jgi:hypothetical protein
LLASTTGRSVFAFTCKTALSRRRVRVRGIGFMDCFFMGYWWTLQEEKRKRRVIYL